MRVVSQALTPLRASRLWWSANAEKSATLTAIGQTRSRLSGSLETSCASRRSSSTPSASDTANAAAPRSDHSRARRIVALARSIGARIIWTLRSPADALRTHALTHRDHGYWGGLAVRRRPRTLLALRHQR